MEKKADALRVNYMYDGRETKDLKIPPLELYLSDEYKQYKESEYVSIHKVGDIISLNAFYDKPETGPVQNDRTLFAFASFINHHDKANIERLFVTPNLMFVFASEDISVG